MKRAVLALCLAACAPTVDEADTYTATQHSAVLSHTARATAYAQCDAGDTAIDGWCRVRGSGAYIAGESFDDPSAPAGYVCSAYAPNRGTLIAEVECERAP